MMNDETEMRRPVAATPMPAADADRLDDLTAGLTRMAADVRRMVALALRCATGRDDIAGREVVRADREVDAAEMALDRAAQALLAEGGLGPEALRRVVVSLKTTTDLERIGDEAVKLAQAGLAVLHRMLDGHRFALRNLGAAVLAMLGDAIEALQDADAAKAERVIAADAGVDAAYRALAESVRQEMSARPEALEPLVHIRFAAKCLERIGDHATNLAEQAVFVATGVDVRHRG